MANRRNRWKFPNIEIDFPNIGGSQVIPHKLLASAAWRGLSEIAKYILFIFWAKRVLPSKKQRNKFGWNSNHIVNNGDIVFTVKEAEDKYNIPASTFKSGRKELVGRWFISIESWGGDHRPNKYRIHYNKWQKWSLTQNQGPDTKHWKKKFKKTSQ